MGMTRKERALKNLKQMCSDERYLGSGSYAPLEVLEDFEVAIKALEQEPTTKNDKIDCKHTDCNNCVNHKYCDYEPTTKNDLGVDCRSLEDIKKLVERKADALDGVMLDAGGVIIGLYFAIANDLPPVTPIRPKGHWIDKQHSFEICSAECSSCHERSNGYVFDNGFSLECEYYDYCPKCGADMREVEE